MTLTFHGEEDELSKWASSQSIGIARDFIDHVVPNHCYLSFCLSYHGGI